MLRKIFSAAMIVCVLLLTACGNEEKPAPPETPTPEFTADKAILAYAQLYACAAPDEPLAAGFSQKFVDKSRQTMFQMFNGYPFSAETLQATAQNFATTLKTRMNLKATLKKSDAVHPVVELTAKPANFADAFKAEDADLQVLLRKWGELQAQGLSDDAIKKDAAFQKLAVDSMSKYLGNIPLKTETTLEVTCKVAVGEDGKLYWAPEDSVAISKFVSGQK